MALIEACVSGARRSRNQRRGHQYVGRVSWVSRDGSDRLENERAGRNITVKQSIWARPNNIASVRKRVASKCPRPFRCIHSLIHSGHAAGLTVL
jgi:hypothetical protein